MSKGSVKRKAVGIDLGTTYSAIAHLDEFGKASILPNAESERITPSVILFDGNSAIVGTVAKQNAVAEPHNIVEYVKREMGKPKTDYHREFSGTHYTAEELSALIIKKLRTDAERNLGTEITDAVITVPAYFNDAQRGATIRAGQIAGLNVLNIINEPTAAALAYGVDRTGDDETVFVFDLGGGTFDTTIMRVEDGKISMLATDGDGYLGGKDWDNLIINHIASSFKKSHGADPRDDLESAQDLAIRALGAKIQLTSRPRTTVVFSHQGKSHRVQLTREEFEVMAEPLVERCRRISAGVIEQAKMGWNNIDRILLVGGMTRMPMIREMLRSIAGLELTDAVNPDEAVAIGAAIQSVLSLMKADGGEHAIPDAVRRRFTDAYGRKLKVTNIATHSLGVVLWDSEKRKEFVYPMIERGKNLPVEKTDQFGTSKPDLTSLTIRVVEGESKDPDMCSNIGVVKLELPGKLPQGTRVNVTYKYDDNQMLEVIAEAGGRAATVSIDRKAGFDDAQLREAQSNLLRIQVS